MEQVPQKPYLAIDPVKLETQLVVCRSLCLTCGQHNLELLGHLIDLLLVLAEVTQFECRLPDH